MKSGNAQSMSLRAKVNNFAKAKGISPQHALQAFFAERLLARIEKSRYRKNIAIKGGTLMGAILGIAQRTTMDVDATVIGLRLDAVSAKELVAEVAATDVGDGIHFEIDPASPNTIAKDDDYGGFSVGLTASFGSIRLPIGIDLTVGDIITPKAERRRFTTILDDRVKISVYAYTVETLIAEKLQTVLRRGDANTRPRDFYDLHMLKARGGIDLPTLRRAVIRTFRNRHSEDALQRWRTVLSVVAESEAMRRQWERYRANAPYTKGISFEATVQSVQDFLEMLTDEGG